jgi:ATP-dependent DNA ligase
MNLPVMPPVKPMLAKAVDGLPEGDLLFEPKWDGFRCIVFRDRGEVELGSRNERPMARYFPELLPAVVAQFPDRCVVDGELVIATDDGLDFEALQQRIHPAESRINRLAAETPASFVAFDVLALGDRDLRSEPLRERRRLLEEVLGHARPPVHVTPMTTDREVAADWFVRFEGAGLDGVIAKPVGDPYVEDRRVQFKVKHQRTADCVVAGFRWHKDGEGVGSLLLGLYDDSGGLHHVGVASSFTAARRKELVEELAPLRERAVEDHPWRDWVEVQQEHRMRAGTEPPGGAAAERSRGSAKRAGAGTERSGVEASAKRQRMPGGWSRWNADKDLSFEPLRCERVVEVRYEHVMSGRFRHSARFLRWRPDRDPQSCTYAQLEEVPPYELSQIFAGETSAP